MATGRRMSGIQGDVSHVRVRLFINDGTFSTTHGRFFEVPEDLATHREQIAQKMASRLQLPSDSGPWKLYYRDGMPYDDEASCLRDGDDVVVVCKGDMFHFKPVAPPVSYANGPREVIVSFFIVNIMKVDSLEGLTELTFQVYFQWVDPLLKGMKVADRPPIEQRWYPEIEINNSRGLEKVFELYPDSMQNEAEGRVVGASRYTGCVFNKMDLRWFPLDVAKLGIKIGPRALNDEECKLVLDPKKHREYPDDPIAGFDGDNIKEFTCDDWHIGAAYAKLSRSGPTGSGRYYSNAEIEFLAYRNANFYVWKVWVLASSFVVCSWSVLFNEPEADYFDRLATVLTLMLAAVAFLFVVGDSLPKVPYLTLMDKTLLLTFAGILLPGLESFIVYLIAKDDDLEMARKCDYWARMILPAMYSVTMAVYIMMGLCARGSAQGTVSTRPKSPRAKEGYHLVQEQAK